MSRRRQFEMIERAVWELLPDWLDLCSVLDGHSAPKQRAARLLLLDMLVVSKWPHRLVVGSDRELATRFRLARNTFADQRDVLVDAMLIEPLPGEGEGYALNPELVAWLRGESVPPGFMVRLLFGARALAAGGAEPEPWVAQILGQAGSEIDPGVAQELNQGGSETEPPHAASPAETKPVDLVDVVDPQTLTDDASDSAEALARLAANTGVDKMRTAATVREQVDRLIGGWSVDDLVEAFRSRWVRYGTGVDKPVAWAVSVLSDFEPLSPRSKRVAEQEATGRARLEREAAPPCHHGTPSGTYRQENGALVCPLCRHQGSEQREMSS